MCTDTVCTSIDVKWLRALECGDQAAWERLVQQWTPALVRFARKYLGNEKDAEDIRDGYSTALYNSRGTFWVDPEGKPEMELAEKYRVKAHSVEQAGFHRLATTLKQLATSYDREAEQITEREPYDD